MAGARGTASDRTRVAAGNTDFGLHTTTAAVDGKLDLCGAFVCVAGVCYTHVDLRL